MFATFAALCTGLTLAVAGGAPSNKPAEKLDLLPHEMKVVEHTNAERARFGLRPLRVDRGLLSSARGHAAWMTRMRNLQHTNQPVGENIAMGQTTPHEVIRDWMNSPGHRANILNGGYTKIGVAAYTASNGTVFWCQQFLR